MKRSIVRLLSAALLLPASQATPEELRVGAQELSSLGVEFARAEIAESVVVAEARAYVTIPPSGDYIVSSSLPGLVSRVHARAGERVAEGDVLLEVQSAEFLTRQQEFLEALHYGALAAARLDRDRQLAEEGIIAERRLEETGADAAAAEGRLAEHRQLLRIAGMRARDIEKLERDRVLQDTLLIRAPVGGAVLELFARAGESVGAVEALCRMADLSTLWLDIHLPQEHASRVRPLMTVDVRESLVERPARVISVGQSVDPDTQIVSVRAEIVKEGHGLKPGQLVAVSLVDEVQQPEDTSLRSVPAAALMRSGDQSFLFVRSSNGVLAIPVTVVGATADRVVISGIGDDEIVVGGVSALKAMWLAADGSGE